jgi:DNA replication protein DnaC
MNEMKKCNKCNRSYSREYCDYCSRESRWNFNKSIKSFSPRIQQDLTNIDIEVNQNELTHVRRGGGLYLTGPVGCGKTLYAAKMMSESIRLTYIEQIGPKLHTFINVSHVLDVIRSSYDSESTETFDHYASVDFLILDDFGVEKLTEWSVEKLYQIINHRYEFLMPVIFTSNLTVSELAERIGDRIPSRIEQMCIVKKMKEIDYRLKK